MSDGFTSLVDRLGDSTRDDPAPGGLMMRWVGLLGCAMFAFSAAAQPPAEKAERWITHIQRVGDKPYGRAIGVCDLSNGKPGEWMPHGRPLPASVLCDDLKRHDYVYRSDPATGPPRRKVECRGGVLAPERGTLKTLPLCDATGRAVPGGD